MGKKLRADLAEVLMDHGGSIATILGEKTEFEGVMEFENSIQIDGIFKGEIKTPGLVVINDGALIKANIDASIVILAGEVEGNIRATDKVIILSGGKLKGNIKTAKLKISDGVVFDGNCEMIKWEKSA